MFFEAKLYQYLNTDAQGERGIPRVHFCGSDNGYNIIVMDLLGMSLEELFQQSKRKFCLKTACMVADQMVQRIEFLHSKGFVHRDIKPDNFLMGHSKR